jgi:hypothetical protein
MASGNKPHWVPPSGGGPGTHPTSAPVRRTVKAPEAGSLHAVGERKFTAKAHHHPGAKAAPQHTDEKIISNYQRQIYELESAKTELQRANVALLDGGAAASHSAYGGGGHHHHGVDGTIRQLRADYQQTERAHAAREAELEAVNDKLRKEALAAGLRLQQALEHEAEAKDHLTDQREKFAAARQELTAEVVAYQRDLDELAHQKRQLQADLQDTNKELKELQDGFRSYDTEKRMLIAQLGLKANELERSSSREAMLRVELNEERVQLAALKEKYDGLKARQTQVDAATNSHLATAAEASAELRKAKIDLEAEQAARRHAEKTNEFLVLEAAHLDAAMKELTSNAEFIAQENARLKHETGNNKVMKAVGRFMIRKMREKLTEAQLSERSMRESQMELNARQVQAEQKAFAIERELMVVRRRLADRESVYEQQRADASELSVENRMLLEKTEQLVVDGERAQKKLALLEAQAVDLKAEVDVSRERLEVTRALARFRPEDLAGISRVNTELAQAIHSILPKLDGRAEGAAPPAAASATLLSSCASSGLQSSAFA